MKKSRPHDHFPPGKWRKSLVLKLKLVVLLCCVGSLSANATYSQQQKLDVAYRDQAITSILDGLKQQTGFRFTYMEGLIPTSQRTSVNLKGATLDQVLEKVLVENGYSYVIDENVVLITRANGRAAQQPAQPQVTVTGRVTDEKGEQVIGVSVIVKGTTRGTVTDVNGNYTLQAPVGSVLEFSIIGMEKREIRTVAGTTTYNVVLKSSEIGIDKVSVISTGIFQRDQMTYTGTTATYTKEELKMVSNNNVLSSIKTLDPSFIMLDDNLRGSDPNTMPTIEVRGQSGVSLNAVKDDFSVDPNQPLFILNGIEVTIQRIIDLDMNRVESVTVMKDAGATALYGSRGANGVIIIETVKAKGGELLVNYAGDFTVQAPDLNVYNMMNAREKLQFDLESGKFNPGYGLAEEVGLEMKELRKYYSHLLSEVERGVDTYWMNEPVHTGFSNKHSVTVTGGGENFAIAVGGNWNGTKGVMKGSERNTWGGNLEVRYQSSNKKLIVNNSTNINGGKAIESPYGAFSTWVNTIPYFRKYNEEGGIDKYLQYVDGLGSTLNTSPITQNIPNPLYNAGLNSKDYSNFFNVSNDLYVQYEIMDNWRVKGGVTLGRSQDKYVKFIPSDHTDFEEVEQLKKGLYTDRDAWSWNYRVYANTSYSRTFNEYHTLTGSIHGEIRQNYNNFIQTRVEGFPSGSNGSPNLAFGYQTDAKPEYANKISRSVGVTGFLNYSYDMRYFVDLQYTLDGATTFGVNELYQPFWSAGLGWNVNREKFARNWDWLDMLRIKGSVGTSGNQNIGTVYSESIYQLYVDSNLFGQGLFLNAYGAPDIPWSVKTTWSGAIDLRMWRGRLWLTFGAYNSQTDPLIIRIPQVLSTGLAEYPMHIGKLTNKGFDWTLKYSPIYNLEKRIMWDIRITGAHNKSTYSGFGSVLDEMNASLGDNNAFEKYMDNHSPNDIWAVRSYGIDPATGQEVFVNKDGTLSYTYDSSQMIVVGSTRPDMEGVLSTSLRYGNFYVSLNFRYRVGADVYNSALYNKVENITKKKLENNQDKRALYDRWRMIGQEAKFKGIYIVTDESPITSRFIQKDNYLRAESISVSYDLNNKPWLTKVGIKGMSFTAYASDLFRLETSKYERGINYPFARTISLKVGISF